MSAKLPMLEASESERMQCMLEKSALLGGLEEKVNTGLGMVLDGMHGVSWRSFLVSDKRRWAGET